MDNSNLDQQFKQSINAVAPKPVAVSHPVSNTNSNPSPNITKQSNSEKLPWIVSIILAAIILIESIALVIFLIIHFNMVNNTYEIEDVEIPEYSNEETVIEEDVSDSNYIYDENYNLTAANLTCVADDGATIVLDTSNNYERYDGSSSTIDSGSYTIKNDSLISLKTSGSDNGKVLYFDSTTIADDLIIYDCERIDAETE